MRRILLPVLAVNVLASSLASGAVNDEDIEQLRQQLAAVSQRLEELAAENAELRRSQAQTATAVAEVQTSVTQAGESVAGIGAESWSDRVRLDGDFRYRYSYIDAQGSASRSRNRIRARTNIKADLVDDVVIGFGLASGGSDPVSTNQTLGGGGSSKNTVLNLAYVDWAAAEGLHLIGGKFKNPLIRVGGQPLMWDADWTPEGLAMTYKRDWLALNVLGTFLESDTIKANDNFSWGLQIAAAGRVGDAKVRGGVAYYSIETKGDSTTFGDAANAGDYFGNSAVEAGGLPCGSTPDQSCVYLYDYLLTEVFGEASFDVGDWATTVFFDYVKNSDAAENDTGWTVGTRIAAPHDKHPVSFTYYYANKEADSLLGLLTDSDYGDGGTDNKGHWLQLNYGINKSWTIGAQYFINETDLSSGSRSDYDRLMIDAQWSWK